jgi:hypothetical protein
MSVPQALAQFQSRELRVVNPEKDVWAFHPAASFVLEDWPRTHETDLWGKPLSFTSIAQNTWFSGFALGIPGRNDPPLGWATDSVPGPGHPDLSPPNTGFPHEEGV